MRNLLNPLEVKFLPSNCEIISLNIRQLWPLPTAPHANALSYTDYKESTNSFILSQRIMHAIVPNSRVAGVLPTYSRHTNIPARISTYPSNLREYDSCRT